MRRKWVRRLLQIGSATVAVPLVLASTCYLKWIACDGRLVTVTEGELYQSAAFVPAELVDTCREYGIKTVIDLRNERPDDVVAAASAARAAGLHHIHLPTLSHPTHDAADAFLQALEHAERPVLVHCQHGEGRSVMMCAIHRMHNEGWSNERAFNGTARLPDGLRFLNVMFPSLRRFRDEHSKGQFVLDYGRGEAVPVGLQAVRAASTR